MNREVRPLRPLRPAPPAPQAGGRKPVSEAEDGAHRSLLRGRNWVPWMVILAVALALRCLVAWLLPTTPLSDFRSYFARGINLLESGTYGVQSGVPDATWPPGYSLWIAALVGVFGPSALVVRLGNAVLGTLTVGIVGGLAGRLWGQRVGWITGLLLAFYPRALLQTSLLGSEALFVPLLAAYLSFSVSGFGRSSSGSSAWKAGLCLGLAALTRSIGYFALFLWPVAAWASGKPWRSLLREFLLLAFVAHAVLLPWGLRNLNTMGHFSWFTSASGMSLLLGNNFKATGQWYDGTEQFRALKERLPRAHDFSLNDHYEATAKRWILKNPRKATRLFRKKLRLMLGDGRRIVILTTQAEEKGVAALPVEHPLRHHGPLLGRGTIISYRGFGVLCVLGLGIGLVRWLRRGGGRDPELATILLLVGAAGLLIGMGALVFGNPRFRWPAVDLLMPLAGLALVQSGALLRRLMLR